MFLTLTEYLCKQYFNISANNHFNSNYLLKNLNKINNSVKNRFIDLYKTVNAGHVGVSLSSCELLVFIKFWLMHKNDKLILSKGHAAALLYSVLAENNEISQKTINTFYKNNTILPAHPPVNKISGIPFATGSLGHGLSLSAGLGLAYKFKKKSTKVFCITSDGELNEGGTWEAAMFIKQHKLINVLWFIDRNYIQGFGRTEEVMQLDPLDKKLESFGFHVITVNNGHDFNELKKAYKQISSTQPNVIIAKTIKGNGWKNFQNTVDCHYLPLSDQDYQQIKKDIK